MRSVVFVFLAVSLVSRCLALNTTVSTTLGAVVGKEKDDGLVVFHSIPFAKPPVGDLRFRPPAPRDPWSQPIDASGLPHICPQQLGLYLGNEDCLYLHVYVPKTATPEQPLPVMFWIFGGGFTIGDGFEFGFYDGQNMANNHNMIVVAPNYRVGVFGFLAHKFLQEEDADGSTGNYGIQDQRMALQWVQDNIKNFGGDPARVTIWGESAGAFSVCSHLGNGQQPGLFSAAIMDSGSCDAEELYQPLEVATNYGSLLVSSLGCELDDGASTLACLRHLTTSQLNKATVPIPQDDDLAATGLEESEPLAADWRLVVKDNEDDWQLQRLAQLAGSLPILAPAMSFGPVLDGSAIGVPELPLVAMRGGRSNNVPLLIGSNLNDGSIFIADIKKVVPDTSLPLKDGDFEKVMHHVFDNATNTDVQPILDAYPSSAFASETQRGAMVIRDFMFVCAGRRAARAVTTAGQPAYIYQFAYRNEWIEELLVGVYHTSELEWVFGNQWPPVVHKFYTDTDKQVSADMSLYWTNFAKYHDPNGQGSDAVAADKRWPLYNEATDLNLRIDRVVEQNNALNKARCDVLDAYMGW